MKQDVIDFLKKDEVLGKFDLEKLLGKPKVESHGDFSLGMFVISKELGLNPAQAAKDFEGSLVKNGLPGFISKIVAMGPFLNFYLNNDLINKEILSSIVNGNGLEVKVENPLKLLIEYPSPNTNKSLHIGHVRNILIGNSLSKIFKKVGHDVVRTCVNNDRGIALCKSMIGYEKFYSNETPESLGLKPDEFVSKCYVRFGAEVKDNPELDVEAQDMLVLWEKGDKKVIALWNKILAWVFEGYKKTYADFRLEEFDREYFESQYYYKGKEIVLNALENKVAGFKVDDENGAVLCDFEDETFGKKYLLRGDGTTLYMTQDLYLAYEKEREFGADKYIFIVGKEQKYHFEVLFEILDRVGFGGIEKNYHFAYGYVYDKNGNKFSSRKGEVIGADWLLANVVDLAKKNLLTKELTKNLKESELDFRSSVIGYGALAFSFLRMNPLNDIKFDIDSALAFEGETGPYVQYTYARIKSILKKSGVEVSSLIEEVDFTLFDEKEVSLIKLLGEYGEVVLDAAQKYKPSGVAQYLIKVSQKFNEFYQSHQILNSDEGESVRLARLYLIDAVSCVLADGLGLLGVDVLEEM